MLCDPLLHLDDEPERVYSKRNDAKEFPDYELHEEISASAVKIDLLTIYDGMVSHPFLPDADSPWRAKPQDILKVY